MRAPESEDRSGQRTGLRLPRRIEPLLRRVLPSSDLDRTFARGSLAALLLRLGGTGLVLLLQILIARILGASGYGAYALATSWITVLVLVATAGTDTAALRFVAAYAGTGEWGLLRGFQRRALQISLITSILLALVFGSVAGLLRERMDPELLPTLIAAACLLPTAVLLQVLAAFLRGLKSIVPALLPQSLLRPVLLAGTVLAFLAWRPDWLSAARLIGLDVAIHVALVLLLIVLVARRIPTDARTAKPVFTSQHWFLTGLPLVAITGIRVAMNRADVIMVGMFLETASAGFYAVAAQLATFVGFGLMAVNTIAAPLFAELHAKGDLQSLQRIARLGARATFAFSLLAGGGLLFLGNPILRLFGEGFLASYAPLAILISAQIVNSLSGSVGFLLAMTGHQRVAAWTTAASGLLNLGLNALLIPLVGLTGAAVATAVSITAWNLALIVLVRRRLEINPTALGLPRENTP